MSPLGDPVDPPDPGAPGDRTDPAGHAIGDPPETSRGAGPDAAPGAHDPEAMPGARAAADARHPEAASEGPSAKSGDPGAAPDVCTPVEVPGVGSLTPVLGPALQRVHREGGEYLERLTDRAPSLAPWDVPVDRLEAQGLAKAWDWAQESGEALLTGSGPRTLVTAGDWHGNLRAAADALALARQVDARAVVQLGDFGLWPGHEGQRFLEALAVLVEEFGVPVVWLDGNHEDFDQLRRAPVHPCGLRPIRPGVAHLPRGTVWSWNGHRFAAVGGATSLDRPRRRTGATWWPGEEIEEDDLLALKGNLDGAAVEVLLTHDAPSALDLPVGHGLAWATEETSRALAHRMRVDTVVEATRPRVNLHGHYHVNHTGYTTVSSGRRVPCVGLALETEPGALRVLTLA